MSAQVLALRPAKPTAVREGLVLGAVLSLPDKLELLEAMGLVNEDFTNMRIAAAMLIARRLAERRLPASALTVVSNGKSGNALAESDIEWMIALESRNVLNREQAIQLAEDLRLEARSRMVARSLRAEVTAIEEGKFSPARVAGALEAISESLANDFAPDDTADSDLMQLMAGWDSNAASGRSLIQPTGIKVLDQAIGGGVPTKLILMVGDPGIGKTAVLGSIIKAQLLLDQGLPPDEQSRTGLFGLEDGTEWLAKRWIAEGTGIPLGEVGWKPRTPEQEVKLAETNERIYPLLRRVECYRRDTITADELVRRATKWVFKRNVKRIFVDHLGEVDHRDPRRKEDYWQQVSETVRRMRNFAIRYSIPVFVLVHTTEEPSKPGAEAPPKASALAGGRSLDRKARLILGLWRKKQSLRCTVLKANEGPQGETVEFERLFEAGLITADGGRLMNLDAERAEERKSRQSDTDEEKSQRDAAKKLRRDEIIAQTKAAKQAKSDKDNPQPKLLDVPSTSKSEGRS